MEDSGPTQTMLMPAPPPLPVRVRRRLKSLQDQALALPSVARSTRAAVVLASSLKDDPITLRAAALTYLTVLSLVPLLAVVFGVFKSFVGTDKLNDQLEKLILENLAVGVQSNFKTYVSELVGRASATTIGGIGFAFLLFSAVSLLANVELAFNHTFRAPRPRPLAMRFGVYWCLLTLGPILLSLSVAGTALLQSSTAFKALGLVRSGTLYFAPFLVTYLAFGLMYLIVPAVPVKRQSALIGALIAGTAWEIAKIGYAAVSAASVRQNAIYGSLSAIPIFLVWTYLSWLILLFGARITYATQQMHVAFREEATGTPVVREVLAARIALGVARAFIAGKPPPSALQLALETHSQESLVMLILEELAQAGLVRSAGEEGWVPARPLSAITLGDLRTAVRGTVPHAKLMEPSTGALVAHWELADKDATKALSMTLEALANVPAAPEERVTEPSMPLPPKL